MKDELSDLRVVPTRVTRASNDEALVQSWIGTFDPVDSRGTLVLYRRVVARFRAWLSSRNLDLRDLSVEDLTEWRDSLRGAPATRATALSVVKSLLGYGHRAGYLGFNVAAAVKAPKVAPDPDARALSEEQVAAMVQEARAALALEQQRPRPRPRHLRGAQLGLNLILWAYFSGCRVTEIANTRWEDLHPRVDGDYNLTVLGKGSKRRTVPMPRRIVEEIAERVPHGRAGRVFPVGPRRVQTITKSLAHRAGLETGVSPHWLRHAHASHAVDGGAPLHVVQRTLGHASLGTTGRYLHRRQDGSAKYLVAL